MSQPARNLLDLMPTRAHRYQATADGRVTVLVPRVPHPLLARLFRRLAAMPFKVRLDETGSYVWTLCDGTTTVEAIAERVRERFGGDSNAALERTVRFVQTLVKGDLVTLAGPARAA